MMYLVVPLSWTVSAGAVQLADVKSVFTCKLKPLEDDGQLTTAVFVDVVLTIAHFIRSFRFVSMVRTLFVLVISSGTTNR
jgi:hypothetical protein